MLATILFTDIVGSTELASRLGDTAWRDLLERHHAIVRRELARFHGRELDTAGDGFFAAFDGPARAVQAAAALRDPLAAIGLEVRAGVHTGECEVSDGKIVGIAVSIGARISSLAGTGRGARLADGQGPRRRLRSPVRGSRRASAQGDPRRVAPLLAGSRVTPPPTARQAAHAGSSYAWARSRVPCVACWTARARTSKTGASWPRSCPPSP